RLAAENGVVTLVDVGGADVLDPQQDERRVVQTRAVALPQQPLPGRRLLGGDLVGGGGVHLHAVAEALTANNDELPQEGKDRDNDAKDRENSLPREVTQVSPPARQRNQSGSCSDYEQ